MSQKRDETGAAVSLSHPALADRWIAAEEKGSAKYCDLLLAGIFVETRVQ